MAKDIYELLKEANKHKDFFSNVIEEGKKQYGLREAEEDIADDNEDVNTEVEMEDEANLDDVPMDDDSDGEMDLPPAPEDETPVGDDSEEMGLEYDGDDLEPNDNEFSDDEFGGDDFGDDNEDMGGDEFGDNLDTQSDIDATNLDYDEVMDLLQNADSESQIVITPVKKFDVKHSAPMTNEAATREKSKARVVPKGWAKHIEKCKSYIKSVGELTVGDEVTEAKLKRIKAALEKGKDKCKKDCGVSCDALIKGISSMITVAESYYDYKKMQEKKEDSEDLLLDEELNEEDDYEFDEKEDEEEEYEDEEEEYEDEEEEYDTEDEIEESRDIKAIKEMDATQLQEAKVSRLLNKTRILSEDIKKVGIKTLAQLTENRKQKEAYDLLKEQSIKAVNLLKEQQLVTTNYLNLKTIFERFELSNKNAKTVLEKFEKVTTLKQSKALTENFINRLMEIQESKTGKKIVETKLPSKEEILSEQTKQDAENKAQNEPKTIQINEDLAKLKRLSGLK